MITDRYWQWFDQQNLEGVLLLCAVGLLLGAIWLIEQERMRRP